MAVRSGYKKYMKKESKKDFSLLQLFILSFFGMLLLFTVVIKSFVPNVDTSIGGDRPEPEIEEREAIVDDRLSDIQNEDRGFGFMDIMKKAEDEPQTEEKTALSKSLKQEPEQTPSSTEVVKQSNTESVYKVFIGTYTSAEQAKVAKDIIQEANINLNPIVKCIGSNNYTLQVGIYKNKSGAEALLSTIQQNHLPGRIVQED